MILIFCRVCNKNGWHFRLNWIKRAILVITFLALQISLQLVYKYLLLQYFFICQYQPQNFPNVFFCIKTIILSSIVLTVKQMPVAKFSQQQFGIFRHEKCSPIAQVFFKLALINVNACKIEIAKVQVMEYTKCFFAATFPPELCALARDVAY